MNPRLSTGEAFAFEAIGWPFATLALGGLLFWLGLPIGSLHLWAGLLLATLAGRLAAGAWTTWAKATGALALVAVAGGAALAWLYDFSGDGQWYHMPAALALAEGWNPVRMPRLADWSPDFNAAAGTAAVYIQHYAKGTWIVAAAIHRAIGSLEAAKVANLLVLLACAPLAAGFLGRAGLPRGWAWLLALAVTLNPVSLYQLPSFFVDGQLAALCTLLIVLSLDCLREPRWPTLAMLVACSVMLVNAKFTGLVYAIALVGLLAALAWWRGPLPGTRRYVVVQLTAIALAVLVVGYQPYVTNTLSQGNPFYPAVGRDKASDEATGGQFNIWAPAPFIAKGRLEKLARSLLAESSGAESMPRIKVPFTLTKQELYIFFNTEPRYGGFGPFFGSLLLATLCAFALAAGRMDRRTWALGGALAIAVMGSALLNPEAWWARLSPQIWLVPSILVGTMAVGSHGWPRTVGAILATALIGNAVLVGALNWGRAVEKNVAFRNQLAQLRSLSEGGRLDVTTHPSFRLITERRLSEQAIPFTRVDKPSCANPMAFSFPAAAPALACARSG